MDINRLVSEVVVKDSASAVADRVTAAMERLKAAEGGVQERAVASTRSLENSARSFERLKASVDPVYAAQQRLANIQLQVNRAVELGTASQAEATRMMQQYRAQMSGATGGVSGFAGALGLANRALATFGIALGARQIIDFGLESLKAAGGLSDLAQQLGVSTGALQGYQYAATQVGVSQEDMQNALAKLTRSIGEAAAGNKTALDAFNQLGIGILDSAGHIRSTEAVSLDLADALARIPDPATRAKLEVDLLSKSGQKLDTVFASGSETIREFQRQAERLGLTLSEEQIKKADEAADKLEALDFQFHKMGQTLAIEIAPALSDVLDITDRMITGRASLAEYAATAFALMNPAVAAGNYLGRHVGVVPGLGPNPNTPSVTVPYSTDVNVAMDPGDPRRRPSNIITSNPGDAAAAKKAQDVIDKLKLQYDQLGRTAEQQKAYNAVSQAGVDINSAAGKAIAALVEKIDAEEKRLAALADMRKRDGDIAAQMDKDRIDAIHRGNELEDQQITQRVKAEQDQQNQILLLQTQLNLIGATNDQRAVEIARVQALIDLHKQEGDALDANEQQYVANAEKIALLTVKIDEQTAAQQAQAKFMEETWKNAIQGIQTTLTDFFDNIQSAGEVTIGSLTDLFNQLGDVWKKTASQVTGKVMMDAVFGSGGAANDNGAAAGGGFDFISAFSKIGGAVPSNGQGYRMTGAGPGASGTPSSGYSYSTAGLSAAANLLPIGAAYASGQSVNTAQLGSGIGGAAGGAIGSIWGPVAGMAGSMVGSVAGGLLGGLFGGGGPPKIKSQTPISVDQFGNYVVDDTYTKNGGQATSSRDPAKAAAQALNDIVKQLGTTVQAGSTNDQFMFYGRTPRYMSVVGGVNHQFGDDAAAAQEAMADFITRSLQLAVKENRLGGLSEVAKTAINASPTGDIDTLNKNIAFAAFYDSLGKIAEPATEASKSVQAIKDQFEDMRQTAIGLGVSLVPLETGLDKALKDYADGFNKTILQGIEAITNPVKLALDNQAELAQQRLREAKAAGADLLQVEKLNALERQQILDQANSGLAQFYEQLSFGGLSGQTATGTRSGSLAAFQAALAQANAGDYTAQGRLQDLGSQFLTASRGVNASSAAYFSDVDLVRQAIAPFLTQGQDPVVNAITATGGETARLMAAQTNQIVQMTQQIAGLREDNASLRAQMARLLSYLDRAA